MSKFKTKTNVLAAMWHPKKHSLLKANFLLCILLCSVITSFAGAITINPDVLPHGTVNASYSHTFTATGDLAGAVWQLKPGDFLPTGLTFNPATQTVSGTPTVAGESVIFHIQVINGSGQADEKEFTIVIDRLPIDLFLVLDQSGSMSTLVTGGGQTRWQALSTGVQSFFSIYKPNLFASGGASGDQVGIRMFSSSDAAPTNAPFNVGQFVPVTNSTDFSQVLNGLSPGGSTAMGPGMLSARNFLFPAGPDNGHTKGILLFTDGEQNIPPNVDISGAHPTVSGTDLTNGGKVQIHTIGLGTPGPASQLLFNIADKSNGVSNIADNNPLTAPDLNLGSYLNTISLQLLAGSTPQYVDVRRGQFDFSGKMFGASESFTVSKKIDKIIVNLLSREQNESQGRIDSIIKDGQNIPLYDTSIAKSQSGNGFQTIVISLTGLKKKIPSFTSDGNWVVSARYPSQLTSPYILSFIVDDHNAEMRGKTTQTKELIVGDKLPLSVNFTKNGKPITNAAAIAIVATSKDIGDLLARTDAKFTIDTSADADNVGTQKLNELLKDSAFAKLLLDSNHVVNLTFDAAQKKYVGEFTHLDVSGVYQVIYQVTATDSSLGQIKRNSEESIYVNFPAVNLDSSGVNLNISQPGISILTFRPAYINPFTNQLMFVGPGWAKGIKIDGNDTLTNVVDKGDGTYVLTINGSAAEDITITIGTSKVYTGKLENIGKGGSGTGGTQIWQQWWFWLIIIIIIIIIWIALRKKKTP